MAFEKPLSVGDVVLVQVSSRHEVPMLGIIQVVEKMMGKPQYSVHPIGAWFSDKDVAFVTECDEMSWSMMPDMNEDQEDDEEGWLDDGGEEGDEEDDGE